MTTENERSTSGTERIPPLNLTEGEAEYLWEMIKEEIGDETVWETDDIETVDSLHSKIGRVTGAFEECGHDE